MDVAGEDGEVGVLVYYDGLESSLIKVADSVVPPVEVSDIGNIEVAHEFGKISQWRFDQQMEVIVHQDVAVEFDG